MMLVEPFFVFIVGLVFGSFVTMASYRMPLDEDIVKKPSRCPKCETPLGFWDLWPVLSWVFSKGKCRHCHAKVSIRYPLTEIATATAFLLVYARYGISAQAVVLALFSVMLLIMIVADFEHYIIPDQVHLVLLPLGIVFHYLRASDPWDVFYGFCAGGGLGLLLHYGYRYLRKKDGLGFGDVKFLAVAGLWLGLMPIPVFLFFSGLLGVLTGLIWRLLGKGPLFPFGPSLAMSLFLCVVYSQYGNLLLNIIQSIK